MIEGCRKCCRFCRLLTFQKATAFILSFYRVKTIINSNDMNKLNLLRKKASNSGAVRLLYQLYAKEVINR